MKRRFRRALRRAVANPVLQKSAASLKPAPTLWGFLGIFLFFILPELIGFWRGHAIAAWAHAHYLETPDRLMRLNYWMLEKLFEEGGSWVNLGIGVALAGWMIYEWKESR